MPDPTLPAVPPPDAPREPLLTVGTITAAVTAVLAMLVAFGLKLDDDRQAAILGVAAVVAPLIVAWLARARVWAPSTVRAVVVQAVAEAKDQTLPTTRTKTVRDEMRGDGPRELR